MKKTAWGFFYLFFFVLLAGCNVTAKDSASNLSLETLQQNYPEIKKTMSGLPKEMANQLKIPSYLPFQIKTASMSVFKPPSSEKVDRVEFSFKGKGVSADVINVFTRDATTPKQWIKLKNGIKASYIKTDRSIAVRWNDPQSNRHYLVEVIDLNGKVSYKKEDLIKIANSMVEE